MNSQTRLSAPLLDHIAIATDNLEKSIQQYEVLLGVKCEHMETLHDRGIRVAFIPLGNTRIELIAPMHENSEVSSFLAKRGGGIHHIAVKSPNVDAHIEELSKKEIRIAQLPREGAHECRVAFVHPASTGGVLLEFSTPSNKS